MAIKKVINGELVSIADRSITDHSELTGTQAYGCHPISAIRKLPEKLHELKAANEKFAEEVGTAVETVREMNDILAQKSEQMNDVMVQVNNTINEISNIRGDANRIGISINGSTVAFTNFNNEVKSFRVGSDTDNDTITTNGAGNITLNKVYSSDEFIGKGTSESPLTLKYKPDGKTIVAIDSLYEVKCIKGDNDDEFISYQTITERNLEVDNKFVTLAEETQSEFSRVDDKIGEVVADQEIVNKVRLQQINDLQARTKGMGGWLNAYDFGKNPTQDALTNYALQDIVILRAEDIFDGTRVKNLFDDNIWIWDKETQTWQNNGKDVSVSDANNDGIHGLITGSYEHLEGFIDTLGHITINGLKEELESIKTGANHDYIQLNDKVESAFDSLSSQIRQEAIDRENTLKNYMSSSGGTINGNLTVTGTLYIN